MIRSGKESARRSLVVSLLVVVTLMVAAAPASAKPGGNGGNGGNGGAGGSGSTGSTATSMTLVTSQWVDSPTGCSYDATYTWAGFKGAALNVAVRLLDRDGAPLAVAPQVVSVPGNGTFTFIFTFNGPGGASRGFYARGAILKSGVEVGGSAANSPIVSATCGGSISISWLTTYPLT